jgi:hypothetical protein
VFSFQEFKNENNAPTYTITINLARIEDKGDVSKIRGLGSKLKAGITFAQNPDNSNELVIKGNKLLMQPIIGVKKNSFNYADDRNRNKSHRYGC